MNVMRPIAEAIDFLQGESHMLFGYFIPTLISVKVKMRRLDSSKLVFFDEINIKLQEALIRRFEKYFKLEEEAIDALVAAVTIPSIRFKFLKVLFETATNFNETKVRQIVQRYALEFSEESQQAAPPQPSPSQPSTSASKSFLDFGEEAAGKISRIWTPLISQSLHCRERLTSTKCPVHRFIHIFYLTYIIFCYRGYYERSFWKRQCR